VTPAGGIGGRAVILGLLGLLTFAVGYLGQGSWRIGAPAGPSAISAIATDVAGGPGSRQPIRVQVSIAVANDGSDQIRVIGFAGADSAVAIMNLEPTSLIVGPGQVGALNADVSVRCDQATALRLPALDTELIDGVRQVLPVGGSGLLLEACSRGTPSVRPLAASIVRSTPGTGSPSTTPSTTTTTGTNPSRDVGPLIIRLTSPTGRRVDVVAIRAGGVSLLAEPFPVSVAGLAPALVRLTAPRTCPRQWQVPGAPRSLAFDLAPGSADGSLTTVPLRLGPELASWLLANSCPEA
jgi:hypothetical protein